MSRVKKQSTKKTRHEMTRQRTQTIDNWATTKQLKRCELVRNWWIFESGIFFQKHWKHWNENNTLSSTTSIAHEIVLNYIVVRFNCVLHLLACILSVRPPSQTKFTAVCVAISVNLVVNREYHDHNTLPVPTNSSGLIIIINTAPPYPHPHFVTTKQHQQQQM